MPAEVLVYVATQTYIGGGGGGADEVMSRVIARQMGLMDMGRNRGRKQATRSFHE